jgi:2-C-methyl-D-erythritol 4-phosphate cytidylyltransferase
MELKGKNVAIFGATSGIGQEVSRLCAEENAQVNRYGRKELDFEDPLFMIKLPHFLLDQDYVVNCAGIIEDNSVSFEKIFNVNVRASWEIANYFIKNTDATANSILFVGSSAYQSGRKNYILYAATKAALVNMAQGVSEALENRNINVNVFNPPRTDTETLRKLLPNADRSNWAHVTDIAKKIIQLLLSKKTGIIYNYSI